MGNRESIFSASARGLFVSFFVVIGITIGLIVVGIVLASVAMSGGKEADGIGNYSMLPNAEGELSPLQRGSPLVLHVDIAGVIGSEELNARAIRAQLERSQQGPLAGRVHAMMVHINSPGGSAFDSDAIYRALSEYKKRHQIPVYVWVDGLCASGGMYSAVAGDKIYASNVSLIGSIGVIATFFNVSETLDKVGIQARTIFRGKDKAAMYPFRKWEVGDDENTQNIIEYLYTEFVDVVVAGRPRVSREKLINEYGAKVFPSPKAQEVGYIDGILPDRNEVLRRLAAEAKLPDDYQVIRLETHNWLHSLFQRQSLFPSKITHELSIPGFGARKQLEGYLFLYDR